MADRKMAANCGKRLRRAAMAALTAFAAASWAGGAAGQALPFGPTEGDGSPVEIEAAESLEWRQDEQLYVARGDARLRREDVEIRADVLTASYTEGEDGSVQVERATATGGVIITAAEGEVTAASAVYDLVRDVVVLRGDPVVLTSADGTVTAEDTMEYYPGQGLAVARGNAVVEREDQRVEAQVLTGEFEEVDGEQELVRVSASGGVLITTATDIVRADEATYDVQANVATLSGNVRLTRGANQLNGDFAEVNLDTGLSRLMARPGGAGRVSGLLVPDQ
ncbi:MAG: hypothetical protein H6843_00435 [Rhodospirillaceae bacterium]|nr:hypothetical protein [Rhodospirillaceae bacterium]